MNQTSLVLFLVLASGCSTFFSRANPDAEKAAENAGNGAYSALENAEPGTLKDQKIQHLESTVTVLNTRIQELEGKLQAARPAADHSVRQTVDGAGDGMKVRASIAANDPGAGFVNDAAVRAFQQGRLLYDQEKFPESILAFSAFLEQNANHALASSAQYYIAENYYRQGDYAVADQEFQKLTFRYPHSPRVSYALVRLSQSAGALGKSDEARRYRIQAEGLFPKSPALKLFREAPAAMSGDAAQTATPIATAPALTIEKPTIPAIDTPTVERPVVEVPQVETPRVRAPSEDLDGPPGAGG